MPPVGSRLTDRKLVAEPLTRFDSRHGDAGHAVHQKRHEHTVPVDRRSHQTVVLEVDHEFLSLAQPQQGAWQRAVHRNGRAVAAAGSEAGIRDGHRQMLAGQHVAPFSRQRTPVSARMATSGPGRKGMAKPEQTCRSGATGQKFPAVDREFVAQGGNAHTLAYAGTGITPQTKSSFSRRRWRAR